MKPGQVMIIAEAGVNHNGSLDTALELVSEAKRCGAHCVKFQTFRAEDVALANAPKAAYQLRNTEPSETQLEMLRKLELPVDAWPVILDACRQEDILFLSTPYSVKDATFLAGLGVEAFKVASGQIVEPLFLRHIASLGKPMIVSTGMATFAEVAQAVALIERSGPDSRQTEGSVFLPPLSLLQCTTDYPSQLEDANLLAIRTMASAFQVPVGFSDHTQGVVAAVVAVALGASIIEKHFTLDKSMPGPDQAASSDPDEFKDLVKAIREAKAALGSGRKEPCNREKKNLTNMRRSLVAARSLSAGSLLTEDDVAFKRPMTGIPPEMLGRLVGKRLAKTISRDQSLDLTITGKDEEGRD